MCGHRPDNLESDAAVVTNLTSMNEKPPQPKPPTTAEIEADYRALAADQEREREAEEWTEGLVGDVANEEG